MFVGMVFAGCSDEGSDSAPKAGARPHPLRTTSSTSVSGPVDRPVPSTRAIVPGTAGSFTFDGGQRLGDQSVKVWYDAPAGDLTQVPVLVVMHGQQRDAERYRDEWTPYSRPKHALLIVPEFSEDNYPGPEAYNLGNLVTVDGAAVPERDWSYSVLEPLFDFVRHETGNQRSGYSLYGHSAGAQFVHRFMLVVSNNRVEQAVSANAGWYTVPRPSVGFPYGLAGSPSTEVGLRRALGAHLTVLLGEDDTDAESDSLRSTPEADQQGSNRFARGHFFYDAGRDEAAQLGTPFGWSLRTVPNAGHDDSEMAPAAAPILLP